MIANLFLHPDSFRHNKIDSKEKVAEKLIALVNDMATVVYDNRKENIFKVPSSLVTVPIFNEMTIVEMAEYLITLKASFGVIADLYHLCEMSVSKTSAIAMILALSGIR